MRHFAELTQNFLLPFERYFQTLIPVPRWSRFSFFIYFMFHYYFIIILLLWNI